MLFVKHSANESLTLESCVKTARDSVEALLGRLPVSKSAPWRYSERVWHLRDGRQQVRLFVRLNTHVLPRHRDDWHDFPKSPYRRVVADIFYKDGKCSLLYSAYCADGTCWPLSDYQFREVVMKWN